jgi:DNA-binding NtrC family response regulator
MRAALQVAVAHDLPVLLQGETGTGKTFLARLIHGCSPRRDHPLLVVPCGALVASLIGSELFGHVKGAFTGADRPAEGKFGVVGQGTLLLDEIDTLGLAQQANLLRIIETGEYEPVGSTQTLRSKARLIFATNVDLDEAAHDGRFRSDLYYRINILTLYLPPLRERVEDILPLAEGVIARACEKFRRPPLTISAEVRAALEAYPWPGNIRQLDNVLQSAVLFCTGPELQFKHLPQAIQEGAFQARDDREGPDGSLEQSCDFHERTLIHRTLLDCDFNCTEAAKVLKVSRTTLYKKIKKYNLMGADGLAAADEAGDAEVPEADDARDATVVQARTARYRSAARRNGEPSLSESVTG